VTVLFSPRLIWITRSEPYCHRDSRAFRNHGLRTLAFPVSHVWPIRALPAPPTDAVIFASAHAVHHHSRERRLQCLPVFTLGDYTEEAALAAGYEHLRTARDLDGLKALIRSTIPTGARLLLFSSTDDGSSFQDAMLGHGYAIARRPVYATSGSTDSELRGALDVLDEVDGICLHSAKGAERVSEIQRERAWSGTIFCISQACADRLDARDGREVRIADEPNERALLDLVRRTWRSSPQAALPARHAVRLPAAQSPGLEPRPRPAPEDLLHEQSASLEDA